MNESSKILIALLTCAVRGESADAVLPERMSDEEIKKFYSLAKKHDVTHLVAASLETAELQDKERYEPFFDEAVKAMYRYEWMKKEQGKIYSLLERYSIPYIPLKGSVIRALYREPWHRTSCDIDVLIPKESMEKALAAFETELSYRRGSRSQNVVSLMAPNGVHLELHFDIYEVHVDCEEFWEDAQLSAPESCQYKLSAEMLILCHIAHMAKHFMIGGCGLKPFLDLWLMREKLTYDQKKLAEMLEGHGLKEFSRTMFGLVDVWFDGKTPNETEMMVQEFILPAGAYGDLENRISVMRACGESRLSYAARRLFPSRSSIAPRYPILNRHPWMLPICYVRRWVRLIFTGRLKRAKTEYNINRRLGAGELDNTEELLKRLGLKKKRFDEK